ncbi:MAG TPA: heme-binding protein [Roseomonas sp.]|jgi:uncharacterized protein GlcG (DUF336 family)
MPRAALLLAAAILTGGAALAQQSTPTPPAPPAAPPAAAAAAPPPGLYVERSITAGLAAEAAAAAVEACGGRGHRVTAVVVDRAGILKAALRADGAGPHSVSAARAKAYTAASTRTGTTQLLEAVRSNPGASRVPDVEGFLVVGGGLPIRLGDEVVGAIGVDGSPGGLLDDQCAEAGIARIRDRLG